MKGATRSVRFLSLPHDINILIKHWYYNIFKEEEQVNNGLPYDTKEFPTSD